MGNVIKGHVETAHKTGICQLSSLKLPEVPPPLLLLAKNLRTLDLSNNEIQLLPETMGNYKMLKSLNLNNNRLRGLCAALCKLRMLQILTVEGNNLITVPNEIDQCISLQTVSLSSNNLRCFPIQFAKLKHLSILDLSDNFIDEIPVHVKNLQAVELNLNDNRISNLPSALSLCPRLKVLRFEDNCVSKEGISTAILCDSNMSLLCYKGNKFSEKDFQDINGYEKYIQRYAATKKKFD